MHSQAEATPTPQGAPEREIVLPELPEAAIPVRYAPAGAAGFNPHMMPPSQPVTFTVTVPQPYYSADQMNERYRQGYAHARTAILEDRARAAQAEAGEVK